MWSDLLWLFPLLQEEAAIDEGQSESPGGTDAPAPDSPRRRAQLAARLRVKAHGLLMAVGKILAVVLIALAGRCGGFCGEGMTQLCISEEAPTLSSCTYLEPFRLKC